MTILPVSLKSQRGFGLVEVMIAVSIFLVIAGISAKKGVEVWENYLAKEEVEEQQIIKKNLQGYAATKSTFNGLSTSVVAGWGLVPKDRIVSPTAISNRFSGAVTFAAATLSTTDDAFAMTSTNIKSSACKSILKAGEGNWEKIDVAGTTVKAFGGTLNDATGPAQCDSAGRVTMIFYGGKE